MHKYVLFFVFSLFLSNLIAQEFTWTSDAWNGVRFYHEGTRARVGEVKIILKGHEAGI